MGKEGIKMANKIAPLNSLDNVSIANAIRAGASSTYQERIPVATQETLQATAAGITSADIYYNEFVSALVNKFAFSYIHDNNIRNPLAFLKRGMLPYGQTVEEIFVDIAKAHHYDPEQAEKTVWRREIPDIAVAYHIINREDFYKKTIERSVLARAFREEGGLARIIGSIVQSLYNGDEYDEWLIFKSLIGYAYAAGFIGAIQVSAITNEATAKALVQQIRAYVNMFSLPSRKYNSLGVMRRVSPEDLLLFIRPETEAAIDVDVLAAAFHMDKAEFLARRVIVDDFGPNTSDVVAMLCDREFMMQWDTVYTTESIWNPEGLYWNNFLHHQGIYSTSRLANALIFTTKGVSVGAATIGGPASIAKGTSQMYSCVFTGDENTYNPQGVYWDIEGAEASGTYINPNGKLTVSRHETATTITLNATSLTNSAVIGTKQVTITG